MLVALALAGALMAQTESAGDRSPKGPTVVVLDHRLEPVRGELRDLRRDAAELLTPQGPVRIEPVAAVIAAAAWGPDRAWPGLGTVSEQSSPEVELAGADGTVLRGSSLAAKGDVLSMIHPTLGKVEMPLDSVLTLSMLGPGGNPAPSQGSGATTRPSATGDVILLSNGDKVEGLVESIAAADQGLQVKLLRGAEPLTIPLARVAQVRLQNPPAKGPAPWAVWLRAGERTSAAELGVENNQARLLRAKDSIAARFDAGLLQGAVRAGAVTPLAACQGRWKPGKVERGEPAVLGADDLVITEPGSAAWRLPPGAIRISGWLALPEECRQMGDVTVKVSVRDAEGTAGREVFSCELRGSSPVAPMTFDVPPGLPGQAWLLVEVGEGRNGPVQDTLVLRRMLVAAPAGGPNGSTGP